LRREVQFLRDRARRLREMADAHQTALSDQLRVMAAELDALADRAEKGARRTKRNNARASRLMARHAPRGDQKLQPAQGAAVDGQS